jgi:hypothetical protein
MYTYAVTLPLLFVLASKVLTGQSRLSSYLWGTWYSQYQRPVNCTDRYVSDTHVRLMPFHFHIFPPSTLHNIAEELTLVQSVVL